MADIEQGKPNIQAVEYTETDKTKVDTDMVPVPEDVQTRIRRKVSISITLVELH